MNCSKTRKDLCRLSKDSYESITLSFAQNVSDDVFTLKIYKGKTVTESITGQSSQVASMWYITFPEFTLTDNDYDYEIYWENFTIPFNEIILFGKYRVTSVPNACGCDSDGTFNFTINQGGIEFPITFSQNIIAANAIPGPKGDPGLSAYQVAVQNGFIGSESEWLQSLIGNTGNNGKSAYQIALDNGYIGTESQWLLSLKGSTGADGKSILQGTTAPSNSLGIQGDSYINTANGDVYLKGSSTWSLTGNIKGVKGDKGDTGNTGATPTPDTISGTNIVLDKVLGRYPASSTPNSATTYTTSGAVLGGWAQVLINAATQPTVTGATLISGSNFTPNTNMYLMIRYNGITTEYYFAKI